MQRQGEWPVKQQAQMFAPNGSVLKETASVYYFEPVRTEDTEGAGGLLGVLQLIRGRKWVILSAALLGTLIGWASAAIQTPKYKAVAEIEIQSMAEADQLYRIIEGDWRGGGGSSSAVTPEAYLETQLHVLQNSSFRTRVLDKLKSAPRAETRSGLSLPRKWLSMLGIQTKSKAPDSLAPVSPEVRILSNTRIVEISCDSPDPEFAADYVNTTATEFVAYNLELQSETAERTMKWLTGQLEEMRKKVELSKASLETYSRQSGLKFEADQPEIEKSKLRDLEKELAAASLERIAKQTAYEVASSADGFMDDRVIEGEEKLIKLRSDLKELTKKYTLEHSRVQQLEAEIEVAERVLATRSSALLSRQRDGYATVLKHEEMLRDALNRQAEIVSIVAKKSMEYGDLQRELERNRKLYEDLLQKATEVSLSTAMRGSSQIRVVDWGGVPKAPYMPVMWKNVGLGLATGLFLGFGLVLLSERACHRLRVPGEAPRYVGVPELSVVPRWQGVVSLVCDNTRKHKIAGLASRLAGALMHKPAKRHAASEQSHLVAEAFRSAAASILAGRRGESEALRIMVTSPFRGEGKSTVVANLGTAIAELGHSVLLVDGDLRVPDLHKAFDLSNSWGFSTLIAESTDLGSLPLAALAQRTQIERLFVLTAGPGPDSVSRVLHSRRTEKLFERLVSEFEFILVDSPPALQFSDARLLGRLVDGTVIVVKAGSTSREALANVKRRFDTDNIQVFGTILNWWNLPISDAYRYYYSYS